MSELLVNTIKKADGTGSLSVPAESGTVVTTASPSLGRRNLIINGAQTIDQRFGGSSELKGSGAKYHTDRFVIYSQAASKITAQQVSEAPAGFKNSLQLTVTNAVTLGATDQYMLQQRIEGQNVSHLAFGTANAETVTLSFYVRSSITGTHSGVLVNGSENRNYPFTYTINAANTWERVSVTITGDTTGTWATTNAVGMWVKWNLGTGSTYLGTAGAWSGSSYLSGATGAVQLIETASATFYITGVQLEVGSVSTPYEHRSFGEELALCQRYYQQLDELGMVAFGYTISVGQSIYLYQFYGGEMRASPTITDASITNGYRYQVSGAEDLRRAGIPNKDAITKINCQFGNNQSTVTANRPARLLLDASGAKIMFDAEL